MATFVSNRDSAGKTDEEGHYKFWSMTYTGNVLTGQNIVQNSTTNMNVRVTEGLIRIPYSDYAYEGWSEGFTLVPIATSDPSNARIDRIIAYIDRSMTFVSTDRNNPGLLKYIAVTGTPNAVPVKASDGTVQTAVGASNPWCELATVRVTAALTAVTNALISDTRVLVNLASTINANHITPIGSINDFAGSTAPTGWLLCYGQAISRDTYKDLFAVLGTTYGVGDGTTTFNIPDCRGRISAGKDNMGGTSANRLTGLSGGVDGDILGTTGGAETVTLVAANQAPLTGTITMHSAGSGTNVGGVNGVFTSNLTNPNNYQPGGTINSGASSVGQYTFSNGGSSTPVNQIQPTIIFNKIIKY